MTEASCRTCLFWCQRKPDDNWGRCRSIQPGFVEGTTAYIQFTSAPGALYLQTKETFFCANFQQCSPTAKRTEENIRSSGIF